MLNGLKSIWIAIIVTEAGYMDKSNKQNAVSLFL